jgi:hypothetical protein
VKRTFPLIFGVLKTAMALMEFDIFGFCVLVLCFGFGLRIIRIIKRFYIIKISFDFYGYFFESE